MRKKSCLTNLLEFSKNVCDSLDDNNPVDVIYLDFQKAFDKVPHNRLIYKLESIGIQGKVLQWISNWLQGRKQKVVICEGESQWINVVSGVPQGSVLGPLLFIIYINDLDDGIRSKILKFADDAKLLRKVGNIDDITTLKQDLNRLLIWSKDWQMLFNVEKCNVMHMGFNNTNQVYNLNGIDIAEVDSISDLGVIINKDFKENKQCVKAAKKANQILGLIYRTIENKDKNILLKLYKSLVRPHLDYCIQVWNPHLSKDISILERVQKRATKMITDLKDFTYEDRLKVLNLTTLETRRVRADLVETYKIIKGLDNVNLESFFRFNVSNNRGHSLKLLKNRFNKDIGKFSFCNRVFTEWNKLPDNVIGSESLNIFKTRLDHYLCTVRGLI